MVLQCPHEVKVYNRMKRSILMSAMTSHFLALSVSIYLLHANYLHIVAFPSYISLLLRKEKKNETQEHKIETQEQKIISMEQNMISQKNKNERQKYNQNNLILTLEHKISSQDNKIAALESIIKSF